MDPPALLVCYGSASSPLPLACTERCPSQPLSAGLALAVGCLLLVLLSIPQLTGSSLSVVSSTTRTPQLVSISSWQRHHSKLLSSSLQDVPPEAVPQCDPVPWPNIPAPPDISGISLRAGSPLNLAYIGDAVWELYMRHAYFNPAQRPDDYSSVVRSATCAEAQAHCYQKLITGNFLTAYEKEVLKWGRNSSRESCVPKRLRGERKGSATYHTGTAVECLVGYLHLTNPQRLAELMAFLDLAPAPP